MARPIKDNADYFTHDADMRDDPKIKALRRKFKIAGYGVWCMLLEAITDSDNFRLKVDLEIIAGDFDVDTDFLQQVMQYCIQLDLLQTNETCTLLWSKTLDNRFEALLSKRKRGRIELSTSKTPQNGIIDVDSTQSKVKESKVKESKVKHSTADADFGDYENWCNEVITGNDRYFENYLINENLKPGDRLAALARDHLGLLAEYPKKRPPDQNRYRLSLLKHIRENLNIKVNGTHKRISNPTTAIIVTGQGFDGEF